MLTERVDVVDGDFSAEELEIPGGIDVVIHCAATVSFDPPIDESFAFITRRGANLTPAARAFMALAERRVQALA